MYQIIPIVHTTSKESSSISVSVALHGAFDLCTCTDSNKLASSAPKKKCKKIWPAVSNVYLLVEWIRDRLPAKDYKFTRPKKMGCKSYLVKHAKWQWSREHIVDGIFNSIITVHIPSPEYSWWHLQQYQQPERQTQLLSEQQANYDDKSTIMDNQCFCFHPRHFITTHHNRSTVLSQQISVKQEKPDMRASARIRIQGT